MKKIIIYSKKSCLHCLNLKRLLLTEGFDFEERIVDEEKYLEEFKSLYEVTQTDALPTLIVGEHLLVPGKSFNKINEIPSLIKKIG